MVCKFYVSKFGCRVSLIISRPVSSFQYVRWFSMQRAGVRSRSDWWPTLFLRGHLRDLFVELRREEPSATRVCIVIADFLDEELGGSEGK